MDSDLAWVNDESGIGQSWRYADAFPGSTLRWPNVDLCTYHRRWTNDVATTSRYRRWV